MKKAAAVLFLVMTSVFISCSKDTVTEPGIIICFELPQVPIRILSSYGDDLLSKSVIPSEKIDMTFITPDTTVTYSHHINQLPQSDSFFISLPLLLKPADHYTVYLQRPGAKKDTLLIETNAASAKPYSIARFTYNKTEYPAIEVFKGRGVWGFEVRQHGY